MSTVNTNGKWHINNSGVASRCTATLRACPFTEHFDSQAAAQAHINNANQNQYGLLPTFTNANVNSVQSSNSAVSSSVSSQNNGQSGNGQSSRLNVQSSGFNNEVEAPLDNLHKLALTRRHLIDKELSLLEKYRMNTKSYKERFDERVNKILDKMGTFGDFIRNSSHTFENVFSPILSNRFINATMTTMKDPTKPLYGHIPNKDEVEDRNAQMNSIVSQSTGRTITADEYVVAFDEIKNLNNSSLSIASSMDLNKVPNGSERIKAQDLLNKHIENLNKISVVKPNGVLDEKGSNYNKMLDRLYQANQTDEESTDGKQARDECNYMLYSIGFCEYPYIRDSKGRPKSYYKKDQHENAKNIFNDNYNMINSGNFIYETEDMFKERIKSTEDELKDFLKQYI